MCRPAPRGYDLAREWVTPGLMDAHTHLTLTEVLGDAPFESFYLSEANAFRALRGMHNAQVLLDRGFTTIRDVGNDGEYAMIDVRRAIDRGLFAWPTVIGSGKIIAPFGGQSHAIAPERGHSGRTNTWMPTRPTRCARPFGATSTTAPA